MPLTCRDCYNMDDHSTRLIQFLVLSRQRLQAFMGV